MTLSGTSWLAPDTVQICDVSMRVQRDAFKNFHTDRIPAPAWLANLARAVSGIPRVWDDVDDEVMLADVKAKHAVSTDVYPPYDQVWKHFFPE